ncbi:MAG: peptidylprolyl isomerase [Methylococcales bacterium]|nr:peptidylprolyl isomerase [Methylococcales bacterium]
MQIVDNLVVSIHYTLTNSEGSELDSSKGEEPLVYLQGAHNIVKGLEEALADKKVGDTFNVTIEPEKAYGLYQEDMQQVVDKSMFEGVEELEVGMMFNADVSHGTGIVSITKIEEDEITIDGNHPLAGETLTFDVEVINIREATADELEHGHIHTGSCQHG